MEVLIDHADAVGFRRLELYVLADNLRAQALYASAGFEHEGTRRAFVQRDDGRFADDFIVARFVDLPA